MVRVSWGGEVVIKDLNLPPSESTTIQNESSCQFPPSAPTPTPPPTTSNTPITSASPSSYSSSSTASPHASTLTSDTCPEGGGSSSNSKVGDSLLEDLKGELLFLTEPSSPRASPTGEMLALKPGRKKSPDEDTNNNKSGLPDDEKDLDIISVASSAESLLEIVEAETSFEKFPTISTCKTTKTVPMVTTRKPQKEDSILSRMLATLSDLEDNLESIDGVDSELDSEVKDEEKEVLLDKWRELFDKFDFEGFGEIPWQEFREVLNHPEFRSSVDVNKREMLALKAHSPQTSAITFQDFVNVMSGKRTRSFKCAVHHRDREVCSENDFHLLIREPPLFNRMVRLIADEFLTEERDRKYYADHYRCWPPPVFILTVTILQLGVFSYYTVVTGEMGWGGPVPLDSPFIYRPDKRQHVWRFIFYAFLHAGWIHLVFNLLVQLLIGLPLEMVHGSTRIGTVYIAGVLAGSLGTSVFDSEVFLVGASGGVYALLAAHLSNVLINYNNMQFGILRLVGVLFVASADVGYAIYDRYAHVSLGLPVSYVAHLTGALAGLTLGLVVLKNFEQRLHEQLLWWVALGIFCACILFAILFNIFHPYPYQGVAQTMFL